MDRSCVGVVARWSLFLETETLGDARERLLLGQHRACSHSDFLALKHESRILGHSFKPVCGISMMEQVRLCAV